MARLQQRSRTRARAHGLMHGGGIEGGTPRRSDSERGMERATAAALIEALQDEYRARATYRSVIKAFGPVRPFIEIVESEDRHVSALLRHFDRLGLEPPTDEWNERIRPPRSLEDACSAAVRDETENADMYERLLIQVEDAGVRRTLARLREASQRHHLPAFQRCCERLQANRS